MKLIPLIGLGSGKHAIVDDDMHDQLSKFRWYVVNSGYVRRSTGRHTGVFMHHEVLGSPLNRGGLADHINRDKLDNRRENLRLVTLAENLHNRLYHNPAGFRGVTLYRRLGRFSAQITKDGQHFYLGLFNTPTAAARAYDRKAIELYGEHAVTNEKLDNYTK
jgi:hypothetical protein